LCVCEFTSLLRTVYARVTRLEGCRDLEIDRYVIQFMYYQLIACPIFWLHRRYYCIKIVTDRRLWGKAGKYLAEGLETCFQVTCRSGFTKEGNSSSN